MSNNGKILYEAVDRSLAVREGWTRRRVPFPVVDEVAVWSDILVPAVHIYFRTERANELDETSAKVLRDALTQWLNR